MKDSSLHEQESREEVAHGNEGAGIVGRSYGGKQPDRHQYRIVARALLCPEAKAGETDSNPKG